jgi:hypothetical protein
MLLPVLLEDEPQSSVICYEIFRQSPTGQPAAPATRLGDRLRRVDVVMPSGYPL